MLRRVIKRQQNKQEKGWGDMVNTVYSSARSEGEIYIFFISVYVSTLVTTTTPVVSVLVKYSHTVDFSRASESARVAVFTSTCQLL